MKDLGIEMKKYFVCVIVLLSIYPKQLIAKDKYELLFNEKVAKEINLLKKYIIKKDIDNVIRYFEFPITDECIINGVEHKLSNKNKELTKDEFKYFFNDIFDEELIKVLSLINLSANKNGWEITEFKTDTILGVKTKFKNIYKIELKVDSLVTLEYIITKYPLGKIVKRKYIKFVEDQDVEAWESAYKLEFKVIDNKIKIKSICAAG